MKLPETSKISKGTVSKLLRKSSTLFFKICFVDITNSQGLDLVFKFLKPLTSGGNNSSYLLNPLNATVAFI